MANSDDDTVSKLRASNGQIRRFPVGQQPYEMAYGGGYIWVTNSSDNTLLKLRLRDGQIEQTYATQSFPTGVLFDGTNVWGANFYSGTLSKLSHGP